VVNRVSSLSFAAFGADGTHCAVHAYVVVVVSAAATKADDNDNDNEKKKKKKKEKKDTIVDEERVTSPQVGSEEKKKFPLFGFFLDDPKP
jgi:hypothetical protein